MLAAHLIALALAAVPPPPAVAPEGDTLRLGAEAAFPNGVAAGDVSQESAVLWARYARPGAVRFEYGTDPAFHEAASTVPVEVVDPARPAKAEITGLKAGMQYYYRAVAPDGAYAVGRFRTPAAPGERRGLRFGVSGDWDQLLAPYPAVRNIASRDLDCFVAMGDTVYADHPGQKQFAPSVTLDEYRAKHLETLSPRHGLNLWPSLRASTGFYAMIDDHEVANDFAGGAPPASDPRFAGQPGAEINETPQYRAGMQAFWETFPVREETYGPEAGPRMAGKPRLYRQRTFGSDAAFMILDARSFRDRMLDRVLSRDLWAAGTFLFNSAWPGRSLLGRPQLDQLKADLLEAERTGITWKFVFVPEPIQAFGILAADDRYEGFAAERAELLGFIQDRRLRNVVFVTADFHGLIVNNISYSWWPLTPANNPATWEIITGPVAVTGVFGESVARIGSQRGFIPPDVKAEYDQVDMAGKDRIIRTFVDRQLRAQFLDPVGLEGSGIPATLEVGDYVAVHYFGWTEFEISGPELTVTTWGIDPYTAAELAADPAGITAREPRVISRFRVPEKVRWQESRVRSAGG